MSINQIIESQHGFLGIDESNHGRYPEIFVAVYSTFYDDIMKCDNLEKNKKKKRNSL